MLIKVDEQIIVDNWDLIVEGMENSGIVSVEEHNSVLENLLTGIAQCWFSYSKSSNSPTGILMDGLVITSITYDEFGKQKFLLIYTIYSFGMAQMKKIWVEGFEKLSKFAFSKGCKRIIGYTENEGLAKIAKILKGEFKYFISIPTFIVED